MRRSGKVITAVLLTLLQRGPVTSRVVARACEIHINTAQSWLKLLREQGTIRVAGWEPDALGRDSTPIYALGEGVSVQRRALTRAEIAKRYRERKQRGQDDQ